MGENIGDLGGIEMAYAAYQRYQAPRMASAPVIGGLTGDQRFFLAYAQAWRDQCARGRAAPAGADQPAQPARMSGSTASSATSTPGTAPSTSSPATGSICRRSSACTSGNPSGRGRETGPFCVSASAIQGSLMKKRIFLLATALLLAGTAPVLAQRRRRARGRRRDGRNMAIAASTSPRATSSVQPGDDFWAYANQAFMRAHPIPADKQHLWRRRRARRADRAQLRDIVEHPGNDAAWPPGRRRSMRAGWTRPGSRRAAPRRCAPISTASPRCTTRPG